MDENLTRTSQGSRPRAHRLEVLIISDGRLLRFPLPASGSVTLGRSSKATVRIDDESVSRVHARIELGSSLQVFDLGSKNGTEVRGVLLDADGAAVRIDEPFVLGDATAVIQSRREDIVATEHQDQSGLEAAFAGLAERARRFGERLLVVRAHPSSRIEGPLGQALARELRGHDCFTLLDNQLTAVMRMESDELEALASAGIAAVLARYGGGSVGSASYPDDGVAFESLIGAADASCGRLHAGAEPVVAHPSSEALFAHARKIAAGDIAVLITGETGVGKGVLAESIHRASQRAGHAFTRLHCGALTEAMLESELFGHAAGAFSGASDAKIGAIEASHQGTLFLDDVGGLPLALQSRLMAFLDSGTATRLGESEGRLLDVRVIAASDSNLGQRVADGDFRRDLFFHLSGATLEMAPLRERKGEIRPLAERFLAEEIARASQTMKTLGDSAARRLQAYDWPGNMRELRNVMRHALLLCEGDRVESAHIAFSPGSLEIPGGASNNPERDRIAAALDECAGNQTRAARLLGISRRTLVKRLDEYNLPRPQKR